MVESRTYGINQGVKEKTKELEEAQRAAVQGAHQAGMAEVATGILHNIGNILNSVNVGAEVIKRIATDSSVGTFGVANKFLQENRPR